MQPHISDAGVPLGPWKSGSTELSLLQPFRTCLLVSSALLPSLLGSSSLPGQARDTTNHSLVSFHPPQRRSLALLPPSQGFFYLRGGALRFLSSFFTGVFASPDFCRYMEG